MSVKALVNDKYYDLHMNKYYFTNSISEEQHTEFLKENFKTYAETEFSNSLFEPLKEKISVLYKAKQPKINFFLNGYGFVEINGESYPPLYNGQRVMSPSRAEKVLKVLNTLNEKDFVDEEYLDENKQKCHISYSSDFKSLKKLLEFSVKVQQKIVFR